MPFDGIVSKCVAQELNMLLSGGRIEKIFQPEADEVIISVRSKGNNYKLLVSANANYARIHLTDAVKENPMSPPMFCMLLRKHFSGGKIIGFEFADYERIITMLVESATELGDLTVKKLIVEIMGRYSNMILVDDSNRIMDAVKHVDSDVSSVREVMPARPYILPPAQEKTSPDMIDAVSFLKSLPELGSIPAEKAMLEKIKGFSPLLCREIFSKADINGKTPAGDITGKTADALAASLENTLDTIRKSSFSPCVIYEDKGYQKPVDYHCIGISQYSFVKPFATVNEAMDAYYTGKDRVERLKQRKSDLLKVLNNNLERVRKKLAIQQEKLRDSADREKLKLYGELITANIYAIDAGAEKAELLNYYSETEEYLSIPLDRNKSPQENAQVYYKKYAKAKSTFNNACIQLEEAEREQNYLESVLQSLDAASANAEITEIRQELAEQGYVAQVRRQGSKKHEQPLPPARYMSSDGFEILAGKNNRQNDLLTMKMAAAYDLWLHTRNIPGSHVIVRTQKKEVPDTTLLEAAIIAAFYSKAGNSSNVPVDYTLVKSVKKPPGAKPGMVTYDNFKTVIVTPEEERVNNLRQK